jgi:hypothetical protein
MLIADSTARALENVAARERDLLRALPADAQFDATRGAQLPCEAPQDAYFITRDENGRRLFLRGNLFMNGGSITDGNGRPVLGYKAADGALQPLRADSVDVSFGFAQDAAIGSDGTVKYGRSTIDPVTGDRRLQYISIGRLALARFPAGTRLADSDSPYAAAPAGIVPHVGVPGDGSFPPLQSSSQMSRDGELDSGLQRLQEAYLALDALRAAGTAQGSVQKTAMDLLK